MRMGGRVCAAPENAATAATPPPRSRSRREKLFDVESFSCLITLLAKIVPHGQYDCILPERLILRQIQVENTRLVALRIKCFVFRGGGLWFGIRHRSVG